MLRVIDEAVGNYSLARKIYRNSARYNKRPLRLEVSDRRDFYQLDRQFSDQELIEQLLTRREGTGRSRTHWHKEERIIACARAYPLMSLRRIASRDRKVGVSHITVRRIIRDEELRSYKVYCVQELRRNDYDIRRRFCRWVLQKIELIPRFLENILFTDESSFSSNSFLNRMPGFGRTETHTL